MSAYVVSDNHIHLLLDAAFLSVTQNHRNIFRYIDHTGQMHEVTETSYDDNGKLIIEANVFGQTLVNENYASVNARYNEHTEPHTYHYRARSVHAKIDAPRVLAAISGYEYQCCERAEWFSSQAHAFCNALRSDIVGTMIRDKHGNYPTDSFSVA
jgi:hypothetical protein